MGEGELISVGGTAEGAASECGVAGGEGGVVSCAGQFAAKKIAKNWSRNTPRTIDFKSCSPCVNYCCGGLLFGAGAGLPPAGAFPAGLIPLILRLSSRRSPCSGGRSITFFGPNALFCTAPRITP